MKRLVLIHSGISEDPVVLLEDRTPLEVARHPALDAIAAGGIGGRIRTIPDGSPPTSEVGTAVLLGLARPPAWPGRAPLEVLGRGLRLPAGALVFRANLMTVVDGVVVDHTAGGVGSPEATEFIRALNQAFAPLGVTMHPGGRHRMLATVDDEVVAVRLERIRPAPAQQLIGHNLAAHLAQGPGSERLAALVERARLVLAGHDINRVRVDLGENPATDIWFWGGGRIEPPPPPRPEVAFMVSDSPVIRGLARSAGWGVSSLGHGERPPALSSLRAEAESALRAYDTVVVYCHRADEVTHRGDIKQKVREIEAFDAEIVAPLAAWVEGSGGPWRIAAVSDHRSLTPRRRHDAGPTPAAIHGTDIEPDATSAFHERALADGRLDLRPAPDLIAGIDAAAE